MLMLYVASGRRYYNWKAMDSECTRVLEYLIKTLMYHISHKLVLHLGTFWRFMRGVMYSGGKETSHGDSWIMAFIYYCYVVSVAYDNPSAATYIYDALEVQAIIIAAYGDDHVWSCPKIFRHLINARGFANFLSECCLMTLRNYKEYDSFLSVPDYITGGLKSKGVVFLKRYFIATPDPALAKVLPYKPINDTMINLMLKEEGCEYVDVLFSCFGQAWDTQGTNPVAYRYVKKFYERLIGSYPVELPVDVLKKYLASGDGKTKLNKLMRRTHITERDLFMSFPSMKTMLARHVYVPDLCKFGHDDTDLFTYEYDF